MKDMIITHMNKDHQMALEDYLVIYKGVSPNEATNAQMKDIDVDKIVLVFGDDGNQQEATIALNPKMKGLQEARTRLVSMAKDSAEKRGFSHVRIKNYLFPSLFESLVLSTLIIMVSSGFFKSFCSEFYPEYSHHIESVSFYSYYFACSIFVIHFVEAALMLLPKLQKYRVPTKLSFVWMLDCLLLGFFTISRFNSLKPPKKN